MLCRHVMTISLSFAKYKKTNTNGQIQKYKYKKTNSKIEIQKLLVRFRHVMMSSLSLVKYKKANTKIQIQNYWLQACDDDQPLTR